MRMKLHKITRYGDYEIYPIFEITDFNALKSLSGYTSRYSNDSISSKAYKTRYFQVINNNIGNYISSNIPIKEDADGNILPKFLRYNNIINGRYYVENDVLSGFSGIQQAVQPADWGTNPHYLQLQNADWGMNTPDGYQTVYVNMPLPVSKYETFNSSATYYLDENRVLLRMFFTDEGNSFTVSKIPVFNSYPSYNPRQYMSGMSLSGTPHQQPNYAYTGENNNLFFGIADIYALSYNGGISGVPTPSIDRNMWTTGFNCPMFFVHYTDNGTDFYGVALVQMSDFTENAYPVAISVNVWDSTFWGTSIISGGESGQGTWGNINIPTVSSGTFTNNSNNVERNNSTYGIATVTTNKINAISDLFRNLAGVFQIYLLGTGTQNSQNWSSLQYIYEELYNDDNSGFLKRYGVSMYNPLSAVLSVHMLPYQFAAAASLWNGSLVPKKMTISGYPVSDKIATAHSITAPEYNILKPLARVDFGEIDIPKYYGGFADYDPYTKMILHLPFIGNVELNANHFAGGKIGIEYVCDIISGNIVVYIWGKDYAGNAQYVQTVNGNCAYNIPMFSMNQDGSAVGKLLSGTMGIVSGAVTGNIGKIAESGGAIIGAAIDSSLAPMSTQIHGELGGNNMLLSPLELFLEIRRPNWIQTMHFQKLYGIAAEMSNCIADCGQENNTGVPYDGFLQISDIDLHDIECTENEKQMILNELQKGVYIRGGEI